LVFLAVLAPRDLCLLRYWRSNSDGSYILCLDSTSHADCPVIENYVRAEFHGAYVIAPPKAKSNHHHFPGKENDDEEANECMVSLIAQIDPKGWIWKTYGYKHSFLREVRVFLFPISSLKFFSFSLCCKY
jgi:hypothetical protein